MIRQLGNLFVLDTNRTTYAFQILPSGHLEHLYYGERISIDSEAEAAVLAEKRLSLPGNTVLLFETPGGIFLILVRWN